ncbi:hypothetical protein PIB30_067779 [Stylosanthes scabra]|uniref:Uncharacterized protein n=1 Tax=Stylosanthes scabra TaxID=79078 RepID=A0ABU6RNL5_9FABA|nr:hypothetical protein [Stylosanthes scabra]
MRRRWMWDRVLENGEHESETVRYGRAVVVADGKRKSDESTSVWGRHELARRLGFLLPQRLRPSTFGERKPSRFGGEDGLGDGWAGSRLGVGKQDAAIPQICKN